MAKIYEFGAVMISGRKDAVSRIRSIGLGLKSGILFFPERVFIEMKPAVRTFLSASGFFVLTILHIISSTFGIIIAGFRGNLEPSDRGHYRMTDADVDALEKEQDL